MGRRAPSGWPGTGSCGKGTPDPGGAQRGHAPDPGGGTPPALPPTTQIGLKGFGDPVTFDNTYYKSLLSKPWENKNDSMAAMIGA